MFLEIAYRGETRHIYGELAERDWANFSLKPTKCLFVGEIDVV